MDRRWHLQQVFSSWVLEGDGHDSVRILSASGDAEDANTHERWPVATLVDELWEDRGPLPIDVATRLNLPADATFAHAVHLLWSLYDDDLFPVSTYPAAVRYLEGLSPELAALYHRAVDERLSGQSPTGNDHDHDAGGAAHSVAGRRPGRDEGDTASPERARG